MSTTQDETALRWLAQLARTQLRLVDEHSCSALKLRPVEVEEDDDEVSVTAMDGELVLVRHVDSDHWAAFARNPAGDRPLGSTPDWAEGCALLIKEAGRLRVAELCRQVFEASRQDQEVPGDPLPGPVVLVAAEPAWVPNAERCECCGHHTGICTTCGRAHHPAVPGGCEGCQ